MLDMGSPFHHKETKVGEQVSRKHPKRKGRTHLLLL